MEANVGNVDRYLRLVSGAVGIVIGLAGLLELLALETAVSVVFLIVGAILIATGYTRQCLLYRPLGIDTTEMDK